MSIAELAELAKPPEASRLLTHAPKSTPEPGRTVVLARPEDLAGEAELGLEEYSLARCLAGEGYDGGGGYIGETSGRVVIAQCVVNEARARGRTLTALLTGADGRYGSQGRQVGYASTAQDPNRWHGQIARYVLAGRVPDLARGGRQFVPPSFYLGGGPPIQNGVEIPGWGQLLDSRFASSAWIGPIPGVNTYHLVVWRREADPDIRSRSRELLEETVAKGDTGPHPGNPDGSWLGKILTVGALGALAALVSRYAA